MPITRHRVLPEFPADVCALYEVFVVLIVTAWPNQDTQKVQIVAQILSKRGLLTAERERRRYQCKQDRNPLFPRDVKIWMVLFLV